MGYVRWGPVHLTTKTNALDANERSTYAWDNRNRLISITQPGQVAGFKYDLFNRRIERSINGQVTRYVYDGAQAVAEIRGSERETIATGLALDEVIGRYSQTRSLAYLTDALGSVMAQARDDGTLQSAYAYSPYGETVTTAGDGQNNSIQYTARENDSTGLYYYRARFYDPLLKRFISEDPIGLRGGMNASEYVGGNPISKKDPRGLQASPEEMGPPSSTRSDGNAHGWGCGDSGTDGYVPDNFFSVDFVPACRRHDNCYDTCNANKLSCDREFYNDLLEQCRRGGGGAACRGAAWFYSYNMRGKASEEAFRKAQQDACGVCK